jgi:hypothetical protein
MAQALRRFTVPVVSAKRALSHNRRLCSLPVLCPLLLVALVIVGVCTSVSMLTQRGAFDYLVDDDDDDSGRVGGLQQRWPPSAPPDASGGAG